MNHDNCCYDLQAFSTCTGWVRHHFKQTRPIPSYLVAIVCGAVEKRQIGRRCAVWSEKEKVDDCAEEFRDTEKILEAAEET